MGKYRASSAKEREGRPGRRYDGGVFGCPRFSRSLSPRLRTITTPGGTVRRAGVIRIMHFDSAHRRLQRTGPRILRAYVRVVGGPARISPRRPRPELLDQLSAQVWLFGKNPSPQVVSPSQVRTTWCGERGAGGGEQVGFWRSLGRFISLRRSRSGRWATTAARPGRPEVRDAGVGNVFPDV